MSRTRLVCAFVTFATLVVSVSAVPAPAFANDSPAGHIGKPPEATHPHAAIEIAGGLAIGDDIRRSTIAPPLGLVSASLDLAPSRYLAFNLGAGVNATGFNFAGSLRLRIAHGRNWAFAPAVGIALGTVSENYSTLDFGAGTRTWSGIVRMPIELGVERRTAWGRVRFYGGFAKLLGSEAPVCNENGTESVCSGAPPSPIYFGAAIANDLHL